MLGVMSSWSPFLWQEEEEDDSEGGDGDIMRTKAKNNALRNIITWKSKCSTPRLIKYKNKSPWPRRFFKTSTPKRTKANTSKVKNVAGTPKVLMHPVLSRGSIEQPVSIDDTLANDVVDLSVIEIPEGTECTDDFMLFS